MKFKITIGTAQVADGYYVQGGWPRNFSQLLKRKLLKLV